MTEPEQDPVEVILEGAMAELEGDPDLVLERLCRSHPEHEVALRRRVGRLRQMGLLATAAEDGRISLGSLRRHLAAGDRIGHYELIRRLGQGGMGEVWLAQQREPLQRVVALKLVRAGMLGESAVSRFKAEKLLLARMQHDGIAKVFDAGTTDDGEPYFAMEYVDGCPIDIYCDRNRLSIDRRLQLFGRVCDAVQHAHQNAVLHRDLKPDNILVAEQDGRAVPKVIDFGLAKQVDDEAARSMQTIPNGLLGTLHYMSPEQAGRGGAQLDTRSDIYALGVILYELLVGVHPLGFGGTEDSIASKLRTICEQMPRSLAAGARSHCGDVANRVAETRGCASVRGLVRSVTTRDLELIVRTCLCKERDRRYASVAALAEDLRRYTESEPLIVRAPGLAYVFSRFVRRNIAVTVAVVAILSVMLVALGLVLMANQRAARSDRRARELKTLRDQVGFADRIESLLYVGPGQTHDLVAIDTWGAEVDRMRGLVTSRIGELERDDALSELDRVVFDGLNEVAETLESRFDGPGGLLERAGRALDWSRDVRCETIEKVASRWRTAVAAVGDVEVMPAYRGLVLQPQLGLIPVGPVPNRPTLYEFRVWTPSGEGPRYGADGELLNPERSDPLVVLIPGGEAVVGSHTARAHRGTPYYCEDALAGEGPPVECVLHPFFIGKHELFQSQWAQWSDERPSLYVADPGENPGKRSAWRLRDTEIGRELPVHRVSYNQARQVLRCYGLDFPTEAQWEYAVRAGTTTPWWTGDDPGDLWDVANLADRCARHFRIGAPAYEDYDDRMAHIASVRVRVLRPNPWGLYDTLGNLWEYCRDDYVSRLSKAELSPGTGEVVTDRSTGQCAMRGGSYLSTAIHARCAYRKKTGRASAFEFYGVRVARDLEPGSWSYPGVKLRGVDPR